MKILRNILIGFVLLLVLLLVMRNLILRIGIEQGMRMATGIRLDIGKFDVQFLKPIVTIKDLKLYNPAGCPDPVMADVEEVYIHYNPMDMLKGQISFKELRFSLREMTVVRQAGNKVNLNALKPLQPHGNGPPPKFNIDDFVLNVGKVVFKDYAQSASSPEIKEFNLNLKEHYTNIHSANELVKLIVARSLVKTTIANLIHLDINALTQGLSDTVMNTLRSNNNPIKGALNLLENQFQGSSSSSK